ncbi:L-threonylcarbamoyladenylate synthase [Nemorincola caseinilytica]|uniref:L-threonylcarbamoyladenylate synthase n=1 Tax=Nemorincola caseinilytica TaxID=2054315 RepID=A0ABP8NNY9_9BACT
MVDTEQDIKACVAALQAGDTILYPTDTVWGLGCDARNEAAVDKVFALKQRPKNKSMIVLLADARDILRYVAAPPPDIIAIVEAFERPTTVIYQNAINLADNVVNADGSIGIRVATDPFCRALIKRFRGPIVSTSANVSGEPAPAIFAHIVPAIKDGAGYVVHHRRDDATLHAPSRIVSINDDGDMIIIRE